MVVEGTLYCIVRFPSPKTHDTFCSPCQQTGVYPYPLGAGSARPNPKRGAPETENPSCMGFTPLRGGLRPWSQTMVSERVDPSLLNLPFSKYTVFFFAGPGRWEMLALIWGIQGEQMVTARKQQTRCSVDSRPWDGPIRLNRVRVPELNPLFCCEMRFGALTISNRRFKTIRANNSIAVKIGLFLRTDSRESPGDSRCESPGHLSPGQNIRHKNVQDRVRLEIIR